MGIESVVLLVEQTCLNSLLATTWSHLYSGMEKGEFRKTRPEADNRLNRLFDIDCEAEFLDLAEHISGSGSVKQVLSENQAYDALLKLVEWTSIGHWEAWEGRCFLYLENAIGSDVGHVDDMYAVSYTHLTLPTKA